ncbi:MAG: Uncharacterised protein [Prochlorococcus marinus str. MIT 9313]|nr:MAG: Uncharacterised protein [Prochlorococcus marinus str. MIT 9313]
MQPLSWALPNPSTGRTQESLLIHRLIGTAVFESIGTVSSEQQQGLTGSISLHRCRQKVGYSGARSGYYSCCSASSSAKTQSQESSRALINGSAKPQAIGTCHSSCSQCKGPRAAAGTKHEMAQPQGMKCLEQAQANQQIVVSKRQSLSLSQCDSRSIPTGEGRLNQFR